MVLSKEELGKLVKEARKIKSEKIDKRYTQVMLANDIDKSQGYIGDIESGRTYPTFRVLSRIAEACEVPFSFFGSTELDFLKRIIINAYTDMPNQEVEEFSNYLLSELKCHKGSPFINIYEDLTLDILRAMYDDFKNQEIISEYLDKNDDDYTAPYVPDDTDTNDYIPVSRSEILDAKSAMDLILSQPGLMLNGELLSDESKIALANAIKLGLQYAEQMQKKEKNNK